MNDIIELKETSKKKNKRSFKNKKEEEVQNNQNYHGTRNELNNLNIYQNNSYIYSNMKILKNLFLKNQLQINKAYALQNKGKYKKSADTLESIQNDIYHLGNLIDNLIVMPILVKETREILSSNTKKNIYLLNNNK